MGSRQLAYRHTLLLLDATGSHHREMTRQIGDSMSFTTSLMRLQDPDQTKVIIVTLAETTPVLEAEVLQKDLEQAGIQPWAWVVNGSISATQPQSPFMRKRAASEVDQIIKVRALSKRMTVAGWWRSHRLATMHTGCLGEASPSGAGLGEVDPSAGRALDRAAAEDIARSLRAMADPTRFNFWVSLSPGRTVAPSLVNSPSSSV